MYKICILGCGISGTLTAIGLSKAGISSDVIELKSENDILNPTDPRTTALNESSISYMKEIGVWSEIEPYTQEIFDIFVCQNMSNNIFHMKGDGNELGRMIRNSDLRRILSKIVIDDDNIKLISNTSYEIDDLNDNSITINLISKEQKINKTYDLAIAADGRFSYAKSKFFSNKIYKDYGQKAIVFDIKHDLPHGGGAIEHFLPRGSFATLPLKNPNESAIVWSESTKIADYFLTADNKTIENHISKFIGGSLGNIEIISKPEAFPLSAFTSEKYYDGRLVLVADSAHSMHPLAGQGLNMGIKDVAKLVELISKTIPLGLELDSIILEKYESSRKLDNSLMVKITDSINFFSTSKVKPFYKFTEAGLSFLNKFPYITKALVSYAKGKR